MPINFPLSPTIGDIYTFGEKSWEWNGSGWQLLPITNLAVDYIDLNTSAGAPTYQQGRIYWDAGNGTPTINLNPDTDLQLGQEIVTLVYNGTGSTITNGSVVAVSGAQGQRPSIVLADADTEATSAATLGIATQDIANGAEGFVTSFGFIRGLDTSAFTAGAPIYLSQTAGQFTATRPLAPAHTVFLGWVIKVNATSGEVFVHISNGWEIAELHDVRITTPTGGDLLAYDETSGYWKNIKLTDGTGISVTETTGGAITVTNTAPDQTVTLTQGGATTITGTYPNFTISSVNTTYSAATSTVLGLIELYSDTVQTVAANAVTATASRTYGLQVNAAGQGVINVPWTDTVYTLPAATSTVRGGIELNSDTVQSTAANAVTSTASRTYGLQVNAAGQGVINVPWTDTTYSAATSTVAGLIELFSDTVQSTAANAVTTTASRTYGIQVNSSGQAVVNVPWTDTVYTLPAATSTVRGGIELGSDTVQTEAANAVTATASRTYALQVNAAGQAVVNVPWTDTNSGGTVTSVAAGNGMSFTTITGTGTVTMGTPSTITNTTTNSVSAGTHSHALTGELVETTTGSPLYYGARAWVNINGASAPASIRASANVTSVTDGGTGVYTVNITTAMPDTNYAVVTSGGSISGTTAALVAAGNYATSSFAIDCRSGSNVSTDRDFVCCGVFR